VKRRDSEMKNWIDERAAEKVSYPRKTFTLGVLLDDEAQAG
jgi:hypothetical protein